MVITARTTETATHIGKELSCGEHDVRLEVFVLHNESHASKSAETNYASSPQHEHPSVLRFGVTRNRDGPCVLYDVSAVQMLNAAETF